MNSSKSYDPAGIGRTPRQRYPRGPLRWVLSPHPSPLPRERVNPSLRGEQSSPVGFPLRVARCSLSLRERVRVRGNGVAYHPACRTIRDTVEVGESSGRARVFRE